MKGYALMDCDGSGYSDTLIRIYLNEEQCKKAENDANEVEQELYNRYQKCRDCKGTDGQEFNQSEICSEAKILTDRYGKYCENDHDNNTYLEHDTYRYEEVEIVE